MKHLTFTDIVPYVDKKLVTVQFHPDDLRLAIFNYSQSCQFEKAWDEVTMQCRGLIMNTESGEVVARPFPKFFNYQEHIAAGKKIPDETPVVTSKEDGSLGILFWIDDVPYIATRGSFASDQAKWATEYFRAHCKNDEWARGVTHLFEIVYPENRIVLNYDFSGLILLAAIDTKTGEDVTQYIAERTGVRKRRVHPADDLEALSALDLPNEEGFVCFYPKANLRLKVKFKEYVRLHKVVTGVSEIGIWEHLRDGKDFSEFLNDVPDEFFKWVTGVKERLEREYAKIEDQARAQFGALSMAGEPVVDRATWAKKIKTMTHPGIGFAMLDGRDYSDSIWKMVRPHGKTVYKVDIDV